MSEEAERKKPETEKLPEPPKEPKQPAMVPVSVVESRGLSALVEWTDGDDAPPQRGYVPIKEVKGGACSARALRAAAPFGVPWAKFAPEIKLSPQDIEAALRRKGIWTLQDMTRRAALFNVVFDMMGLTDMLRKANAAKQR